MLCTASVETDVPRWLRGTGRGWVTAEYSMLPGSTAERASREAARGKQSGRTQEIQRLIGRSLRAVTDLTGLAELQITLDCDVLQADGGTRTAAICGGYVALHDACTRLVDRGTLARHPLTDQVAAVSVGLIDAIAMLDLPSPQATSATRAGGSSLRRVWMAATAGNQSLASRLSNIGWVKRACPSCRSAP